MKQIFCESNINTKTSYLKNLWEVVKSFNIVWKRNLGYSSKMKKLTKKWKLFKNDVINGNVENNPTFYQLKFLMLIDEFPTMLTADFIYERGKSSQKFNGQFQTFIITPLRSIRSIKFQKPVYIQSKEFDLPVNEDTKYILTPPMYSTKNKDTIDEQLKTNHIAFTTLIKNGEEWDSPNNQRCTTYLAPDKQFFETYYHLLKKHWIKNIWKYIISDGTILAVFISLLLSLLAIFISLSHQIMIVVSYLLSHN